MNFTREELKI